MTDDMREAINMNVLSAGEREKLVQFCRDIVAIPSLSGQEGDVADRIRTEMIRLGYDHVQVDPAGNVIGRIGPANYADAVLFDAHMDTIPLVEPNEWRYDPWGGVLVDGAINGLGAVDIKGGLAAMVYGVASLQRVRDQLKRPLVMCCSVFEEEAEGACTSEAMDALGSEPAAAVICEPTSLRLAVAQRGRAEIVVEVLGKSAHSAFPDEGVNAVRQMMRLLPHLDAITLDENPVLGPAAMELTQIISDPFPSQSVVPERCIAHFDRRTLPGETAETVLGPMQTAIDELTREDAVFRADVRVNTWENDAYTGRHVARPLFAPAWLTPIESPIVQRALTGMESAGLPGDTTVWLTCSDGSATGGERGIPTIGFGPCDDERSHQPNESIQVEQLYQATDAYHHIGLQLSCTDAFM